MYSGLIFYTRVHIYLGYITILKHTQHKRRIVGRQTEREEISKNCALRRTLTRWTKNIITSPSTVSGFLSSVLSVWPDDHLYEVVYKYYNTILFYFIDHYIQHSHNLIHISKHLQEVSNTSINDHTKGVPMHYRSVIVYRKGHPMLNIYLVTKSKM